MKRIYKIFHKSLTPTLNNYITDLSIDFFDFRGKIFHVQIGLCLRILLGVLNNRNWPHWFTSVSRSPLQDWLAPFQLSFRFSHGLRGFAPFAMSTGLGCDFLEGLYFGNGSKSLRLRGNTGHRWNSNYKRWVPIDRFVKHSEVVVHVVDVDNLLTGFGILYGRFDGFICRNTLVQQLIEK